MQFNGQYTELHAIERHKYMKLLVSVGKKPVQQHEITLVKPSLTHQKIFGEIIFYWNHCVTLKTVRLKKQITKWSPLSQN